MEFKRYRRTNVAEMRAYVPGEDLSNVSVNPVDTPAEGGFVARNPSNHADQWYVAAEYADENFDLATNDHAPVKGYKPMSEKQLHRMNVIKTVAKHVGDLVDTLSDSPETDNRWGAIARSDLQKGFMSLTRSVAKPDFF